MCGQQRSGVTKAVGGLGPGHGWVWSEQLTGLSCPSTTGLASGQGSRWGCLCGLQLSAGVPGLRLLHMLDVAPAHHSQWRGLSRVS